MEQNIKSIIEMARGALGERIDYEMPKIIENILDPNTKATAPRELTVKIKLTPDDTRENISVDFTVSPPKLTATNPIRTNLYVAGENGSGEMQVLEMVPQVPGQLGLDGSEQEGPAKLRIVGG